MDNVAVALAALASGDCVEGGTLTCRADIPTGHKVAVEAISEGQEIRKFGQIIGFASGPVAAGDHVHLHNCIVRPFVRDHAHGADFLPTDFIPEPERATFQGIVRTDGRVATRNYVGILTTVNCAATVARQIARFFDGGELDGYPNVDGVAAFVHGTGCGMAGDGEGFAILQRTLQGYLRHPNLGAVLLIGLGCEVAQIKFLLEASGLKESELLQTLSIQETGGTRASVAEGVRAVKAMLPIADKVSRETVPAAHLNVGLQCGGSDAYSALTANPALGATVDLLVRHGGTAILSETPEIIGAEHLLLRRAADQSVADKLLARLDWWRDYVERQGARFDHNPSPGNRDGGITTILEKSLGAVAKGGSTGLNDVICYAEPLKVKGLVFMDGPGYDPVSATGEVASGANLICFTTGRGSVYGCKPVPSIKLASTSNLYRRMEGDMDIDCGPLLNEDISVQDMGRRIFAHMLDIASGRQSKSEAMGFGEDEFAPWVVGAVM